LAVFEHCCGIKGIATALFFGLVNLHVMLHQKSMALVVQNKTEGDETSEN